MLFGREMTTLEGVVNAVGDPFFFDYDPSLRLPVFKATQREFFERLIDHDEVYINTTFNLADENRFGRGVGDKNEGSRLLLYPRGQLSNVPIFNTQSAIQTYLFCCASRIDRHLLNVWGAEVVYQINSLDFFREISRALSKRAAFCLIAPVKYGDWSIRGADAHLIGHYMDQINLPGTPKANWRWPSVVFMKDHDLAYQHEVRATWEPPFAPEERVQFRLYGDDPRGDLGRWEADRLEMLRARGVRMDHQPIVLQVPGIQKYIEEVPIETLR